MSAHDDNNFISDAHWYLKIYIIGQPNVYIVNVIYILFTNKNKEKWNNR